jgi:MFS family permease
MSINKSLKIPLKKLISVVTLVSSSFSWLFLFFAFFGDLFKNSGLTSDTINFGYLLFLGFAVFSALIGCLISEKISRRKFLFWWLMFGLLANILVVPFEGFGTVLFLIMSSILGLSLGLGFPTCLAYLTDSTELEERARVTGVTIFVTLIIVMATTLLGSAIGYGLGIVVLLCAVRSISFISFALDSTEKGSFETKSWREVLTRKDFVLYLIPWLMFSLTGGLQDWIYRELPESLYTLSMSIGFPLHFLSWAIFGVISGIIADRTGRKQPIIMGLVMIGIGFGILGIFPNPYTIIIYNIISGIAWGSLFTVYITVLGDLTYPGSRERFFALGVIMPLTIALGFQTVSSSIDVSFPIASLSSVLSIILFVSVIPVLRASETLSNKRIRERKLKEHLEKIEELIKENREKDQNSSSSNI